jgi:hypothetical protein
MNQGLLWLADNLRISYGDGLLSLARMILRAARIYPLALEGSVLPLMDADAPLNLRWPGWYPADSLDRQRQAETMNSLVAAKQISRETALRVLGPMFGIEDGSVELARIKAEEGG